MEELQVRLLLGTDKFIDMLNGFPDDFYHLPATTREAFFKALLARINDGMTDLVYIIRFSYTWLELYREIKNAVHGSSLEL